LINALRIGEAVKVDGGVALLTGLDKESALKADGLA